MTKDNRKMIRLILWVAIFTIIFLQATVSMTGTQYWISSVVGLLLLFVLFFLRKTPG